MNRLRVKFGSLGGLIFVGLLIFFLLKSENVQAAWSYRSSEAIDPAIICRDGMYIGVGVDAFSPTQVSIRVRLYPGGNTDPQIALENYTPLLSTLPGTPTYADYYYLYWDQAYQPLPAGTQISIDSATSSVDTYHFTVEDCFIDSSQSSRNSAITYQGRLDDGGNPANGVYDFRFRLFDAANGGNQIGTTVWKQDVTVTDGLFTLNLNFGSEAFQGSEQWLQIGVRPGNETGGLTILNPRQTLTAVPMAHTLRPGAIISDSIPVEGLLYLNNTLGDGLVINQAITGVNVEVADLYGVHVQTADNAGIFVEEVGSFFDYIGDGIGVGTAWGNGVYVNSSGVDGMKIDYAGDDGVDIEAAGGRGVEIGTTGSDGIYIYDANNHGISIYDAAIHGVEINTAGFDGVHVSNTGGDGFEVDTAGDNGLDIGTTGGAAVYISTAGGDGVYVGNASGGDGLDIDAAFDKGIEVSNAASYEGYFLGDVYISGTCSGCIIATFGLNSSNTTLARGDIVSIQGVRNTDNIIDQSLLFEVAPHREGQSVIGVVQGRAELAVDDDIDEETNRPREYLEPGEGPAAPGDYVLIVIFGPMQVRANPGSQTIVAGNRLAVADNGQARALQTVMVNGVQLAESAPTIGIALEDMAANDADGLIWVLVNPQ